MALPPSLSLADGWELCATAPGAVPQPEGAGGLAWTRLPRLACVAAALRELGQWSLDGAPRRFDAEDWWYRLRFDAPAGLDGPALRDAELLFDGLATICQVWLNGTLLLDSGNMFLAHRCPVGGLLRPAGNELMLCFRSLDQALAARRPRPRWRVPMAEHQQLRWIRTTLLGRTPGWSPPAQVVGPWGGIRLEAGGTPRLADRRLQVSVQADGTGLVDFSAGVAGLQGVSGAQLVLARGDRSWTAALQSDAQGRWSGRLQVEQVQRWWPHTHGEPALYAAELRLHGEASGDASGEAHVLPLGRIGFRTLRVDRSGDGFRIEVNGLPVFCRGAGWTPLDPVTLRADPAQQAAAVAQAREAGFNMLRVAGTLAYEDDAFFDACDAQGLLVWQDFMFANFDYPQDEAFDASVRQEAQQQLQRWQGRASLAVLCGNSEVEQQAAMWGAPRDLWQPALFHGLLAALAADWLPDVPYWPSSAHGGAFPHQADTGTTSYYGVGAYLREPADARLAAPRFATECLAFANVPEAAAIARMPGGPSLRVHHPAWKARVPRDLGAGWDFEDVRDHYLGRLFQVDPVKLRYADHERYLLLSRLASAHAMAGAFQEWRRAGSPCGGALILFLRDLWPGAGWGVVDSLGQPKACWHLLRQVLQPVSVAVSDEGVNGLHLHLHNEGPQPLQAQLQWSAWRGGQTVVEQAAREVELPAHGSLSLPALALAERFVDLSYAYRFGPAGFEVFAARLLGADGQALGESFWFPQGFPAQAEADVGLQCSAALAADGSIDVEVQAARIALGVHAELDRYVADDAYFHLLPGVRRRLRLRPLAGARVDPATLRGQLRAVNSQAGCVLRINA